MPSVSHWKQELRQHMSPLMLKARSAVHGLTTSCSCLPDYYQVCCASFRSSLDSTVKRREASVAPTTINAAAKLGCVLALNRNPIKCYIHLESVNSNKVSRTDTEKPYAKVWGHRFRTKFICHMRKLIFWLTSGATAFYISHHILNEVQIPPTFLPLETLEK